MQRGETRQFAADLSDDHERRRISRDPLDPGCRLLRARRVAELFEQARERS